MLLFRSDEHLQEWLSRSNPSGESLSLETQWKLARRWFEGRDGPEWRKRTAEEAEEVFRGVGLTSDFWHLS